MKNNETSALGRGFETFIIKRKDVRKAEAALYETAQNAYFDGWKDGMCAAINYTDNTETKEIIKLQIRIEELEQENKKLLEQQWLRKKIKESFSKPSSFMN